MERRLAAFSSASFDIANLRKRVITALVLAPLVLAAVYLGGWIYPVVIALTVALGLREWLRLVDPSGNRAVVLAAHASLLLVMGCGAVLSPSFGLALGVVLVPMLFLLAARDHKDQARWVALGIPYMAGSGLALLYLRETPEIGMGLCYYLLAVVWGTDTGAFLAGTLSGVPKLVPEISPHKTWAGLFGGMALAAVLGYGVATGFGARRMGIALLLALALALVSQLGDMFKSTFKRRSGVKESGGLIPGHGGVLDRIDGLVFAAIFFVLFQIALGAQMQWW